MMPDTILTDEERALGRQYAVGALAGRSELERLHLLGEEMTLAVEALARLRGQYIRLVGLTEAVAGVPRIPNFSEWLQTRKLEVAAGLARGTLGNDHDVAR